MTFARLRNLVADLKRKYADELAVYRSRPFALELCDQMADAVTPGRPRSTMTCNDLAFSLFTRLRDRGIRVNSHLGLSNYLSDCPDKLFLPQVNDVLRSLFPKARDKGLIPPSRIEVPFRPRRIWKHGMVTSWLYWPMRTGPLVLAGPGANRTPPLCQPPPPSAFDQLPPGPASSRAIAL